MVYSMTVDKPPPFTSVALATWRRRAEAWRSVHYPAPELTIVGVLMTHTQDPLFLKIGDALMAETRYRLERRAFDAYLSRLGEVFGTRRDVVSLDTLR